MSPGPSTTHEGQPPAGWLSPWIAETLHTPDLLQEAGYSYLMDWCMDDQPVWLQTRGGHILSLPYPRRSTTVPRSWGARWERPSLPTW